MSGMGESRSSPQPTSSPAQVQTELRGALFDAMTRAQQRMYHENASFHAAVTVLAGMIPAWLDGMARQADIDEKDRQLRITHLATDHRRNPMPDDHEDD
jgi:hypothetical protein